MSGYGTSDSTELYKSVVTFLHGLAIVCAALWYKAVRTPVQHLFFFGRLYKTVHKTLGGKSFAEEGLFRVHKLVLHSQSPRWAGTVCRPCMLRRQPEACTLARTFQFAARAQVFHTQHARTTDAYRAQGMRVPNMHATAYCTALCACCVPRAVSSGWYTYCVLQPDVRRVSSAVLRASGALRSVSVTHEYSTSRYPRPAGRCAVSPEHTAVSHTQSSSRIAVCLLACSCRVVM